MKINKQLKLAGIFALGGAFIGGWISVFTNFDNFIANTIVGALVGIGILAMFEGNKK